MFQHATDNVDYSVQHETNIVPENPPLFHQFMN
jgi:hypothetical protein